VQQELLSLQVDGFPITTIWNDAPGGLLSYPDNQKVLVLNPVKQRRTQVNGCIPDAMAFSRE